MKVWKTTGFALGVLALLSGCSPQSSTHSQIQKTVMKELRIVVNNDTSASNTGVVANAGSYMLTSATYDEMTHKIVATGEEKDGYRVLEFDAQHMADPVIVTPPLIAGQKLQIAPSVVYSYKGIVLVIGANAISEGKNQFKTIAYLMNLKTNHPIKQLYFPNIIESARGNGPTVYLTSINPNGKNELFQFNMNTQSSSAVVSNIFNVPWDAVRVGSTIYGLGRSPQNGGITPTPTHFLELDAHRVKNLIDIPEGCIAFAFSDGSAYFAFADSSQIECYNVKNHQTSKWRIQGNARDLLVQNGQVVVVTDKGINVLDATTGKSLLFKPISNADLVVSTNVRESQ